MLTYALGIAFKLLDFFMKKSEQREIYKQKILEAAYAFNSTAVESARFNEENRELRQRYLDSLKNSADTKSEP